MSCGTGTPMPEFLYYHIVPLEAHAHILVVSVNYSHNLIMSASNCLVYICPLKSGSRVCDPIFFNAGLICSCMCWNMFTDSII